LKAASTGTFPKYGVVLSPAELSEVDYRTAVLQPAERTPEIKAYLAAHQSTFGGQYLDQPGGGKVTFLFTSDVATRRAELLKIFTASADRLVVRQVDYTDGALNAAQNRLTVKFSAISGLGLISTSVDTIRNALLVTATGANATSLMALQRAVGDPGVLVLLQPGTPPLALDNGLGSRP
jgi:hypothetical protein